jgi:hypothetical protein|nr:MAG TPA: hypothetical protein [Caudoviricetes sp.]
MDKVSRNLEKLEQLNRSAERLLKDLKIRSRMIEYDIKMLNRNNKRIKMLLNGWKAVKRPEIKE